MLSPDERRKVEATALHQWLTDLREQRPNRAKAYKLTADDMVALNWQAFSLFDQDFLKQLHISPA